MTKKPSEAQILKDVRRAYVLAKALNIQYQYIREYVNVDMYKTISTAKGTNSYFIKQIDLAFGRKNVENQLDYDEQMAFKILEELEELERSEKLELIERKKKKDD
jgi:hypothetical protein